MKELEGKTGVLVRTGPALSGWGNYNTGLIPTLGQLSESEEKHLRLRVKADLRQCKWNENQTLLATPIHTPDGAVAGSWSLGIVEQSPGKGYC